MNRSRRDFLQSLGTGALGAGLVSRSAGMLQAFPLNRPPGLQLWSVRGDLAKDEDATLREIARIGYRELEHYEMPASPAEFRRKCARVGLNCISSHWDVPMTQFGSQKSIDAAKELGLEYMIVVFPTLRSLSGAKAPHLTFHQQTALYEKISVDDYKWNGEQLNLYGEKLKKAGLKLGYHNHAIDLKKLKGGVVGFDTLIQATDPNLVVFEMDCGHVIHAGADPIAYLQEYPYRIRLLHLKDLKPGYSVSTTLDTEDKDTNAEIGSGSIDWKRLFSVVKPGQVKHCFVEHEGKMDHLPMESIRISFDYLKQM